MVRGVLFNEIKVLIYCMNTRIIINNPKINTGRLFKLLAFMALIPVSIILLIVGSIGIKEYLEAKKYENEISSLFKTLNIKGVSSHKTNCELFETSCPYATGSATVDLKTNSDIQQYAARVHDTYDKNYIVQDNQCRVDRGEYYCSINVSSASKNVSLGISVSKNSLKVYSGQRT